MAELANQKVLRIANKNNTDKPLNYITEGVVEERRAKVVYYKWISRLMALLATASLCYGIAATLAIFRLVPRIMYDAQIFVKEPSDSRLLVKREHIDRKMASREKIMVNFIKQYVELRNTFIQDESEMRKRWLWGGLVSYLSNYSVYKDFERFYPHLMDEMKERRASRAVEILSVERSGGEKSYVWKVEFKTYDFTFGAATDYGNKNIKPQITEKYWTANIRCYANPKRRTSYRRMLNPLGFVVSSYYQSEIEH